MVLAAPLANGQAIIGYLELDSTSQILPIVCLNTVAAPESIADVDFDYASLAINIVAETAAGTALTEFAYTGANIDDGPGTGAWGDPTTSAIEVDQDSQGCPRLHIRDEVNGVTGSKALLISIGDGGSTLITKVVRISQEFATGPDLSDLIDARITAAGLATAANLSSHDSALSSVASAVGSLPDADANADAVWEEDLADHDSVAGSGAAALLALHQVAEGVCASGSASTCVDAGLTEVDDHWHGKLFKVTSGALLGQSACVYAFVAATDTLNFRPDLTGDVSGLAYELQDASGCEAVITP
jgi:hypothetical protein